MKKHSLPAIQEKVKELYEHNGWKTDPALLLLAISEELGELTARWLAEYPGYEKSKKDTDPIPEEVGDLLQLIIAFCNTQELNFVECVEASIKKRRK